MSTSIKCTVWYGMVWYGMVEACGRVAGGRSVQVLVRMRTASLSRYCGWAYLPHLSKNPIFNYWVLGLTQHCASCIVRCVLVLVLVLVRVGPTGGRCALAPFNITHPTDWNASG